MTTLGSRNKTLGIWRMSQSRADALISIHPRDLEGTISETCLRSLLLQHLLCEIMFWPRIPQAKTANSFFFL